MKKADSGSDFSWHPRLCIGGKNAFSLVEVVVAVGIFAVAVLSILGLLLPNTRTVAEQVDATVAKRLADNIQFELSRYGFANVVTGLPAVNSRLFMVATEDGSRVLVTGEDVYTAWADTYGSYDPSSGTNYSVVAGPARPAENNLATAGVPGSPPGIAFRDRFFLIEVSWPDHHPQYVANQAVMPLNIRILWPYRLPNGPANPGVNSPYNDAVNLPWRVVSPSNHSALLYNLALTP